MAGISGNSAQLAADLHRVADGLESMPDADAKAAGLVVSAVRARAPKRSGRLANNIVPTTEGAGAQINLRTIEYAGVIDAGWPARHIRASMFMAKGFADVEGQVTDVYVDEVEELINKVGG